MTASTPQVWLLGQGFKVGVHRVGLHAHNMLVSALFVHGISGLIWACIFFGMMLMRSVWMVRNAGEPYRMIASGVLCGLLAWGIGGLTLDTLYDPNSRYVYFFYAVLVERAFVLARQAQSTSASPQPVWGDSGAARYSPRSTTPSLVGGEAQ